jgi:transcription-repair coupling factor (superfamily II helicase)
LNPGDLLDYFLHDPKIREITALLPAHSPLSRRSAPPSKPSPLSPLSPHSPHSPHSPTRSRLNLRGLVGSSSSFVTAAVYRSTRAIHFCILPDRETAAYFCNDLEQILDEKEADIERKEVLFFPGSFRKGLHSGIKDNQGLLSRTEVLNRVNGGAERFLVVSYPEAVSEKVVNKEYFAKSTMKLATGEQVNMDFILDLLIEYEFERTDFVIEPGQFSLRGGLIDVYSFSGDHPFRIEFAGNRIESIRTFDPTSQLSVEKKDEITIIPDIRVRSDKKIAYESVLEMLPERSVVWLKETGFIADLMDKQPASDLLLTGSDFLKQLLSYSTIETGREIFFRKATEIVFNTAPQPSFNKNFDLLTADLRNNTTEGFRNLLLSDNPKQRERLVTILEDIQAKDPSGNPIEFTSLHYSLHEGFIEKDLRLACYTDHQIFERYHRFHLRDGYSSKEALTLKEVYDLKPGDYVTHIDHGIGRFDGLEKIENNGREQEAIRLIYKNDDILYVSIHSLHRITKYLGKEGTVPTLNRLGSDAWTKLKNKTKSRVKDIAKELIALYAKRKASNGMACSPDTYFQTELEASFIYEDTPDQIKATVDVKKDMEATWPMDRLICGDVGFGKTEIAVRAAFKMVTESRQVAILVPTTILALQHHKTFSERLKGFPANVSYINRFRSAKEQKRIIEDTKSGKIDILIGTHRLLGKDIVFKDLGLLIIDEEQKFGVSAKEKIKHFKVNVDTLTLTATPIPRTLQFSLMGARDLSIINTPPPNRYPVQTELHSFNEEIIKDAVEYEIARGGQVFFVTTRIQNIMEIAGMIQRVVPRVNVAVAHGQMEGHKLEKVMVEFIEGEHDVLVSTTIVESGLDIPNVNTIIINEAHHYGLSDLHQLRGRVGRSNKKAFCYLLAPPLSVLTDEARKRLRAIEEFSDLGSGFSIAMRDLDIRGAGNILGAEQSGFISEIGFEMYQKILDEAILELKEQDFKDLYTQERPAEFAKDCQIETDFEVLIPDHYITNITERLSLYKELDSVENEENLRKYRERLADRFGPLPEQTESLIETIRLRWLAKEIGFEKIVLRNNRMTCFFIGNPESPYYQSQQFNTVLDVIKNVRDFGKIREEKERLTLTFAAIPDVPAALEQIRRIPIVNRLNETPPGF